MRLILTLLVLALTIFSIWSFVDYDYWLMGPSPKAWSWWWPTEISTFGEPIDFLFYLISVMILVAFVGTMGALAWFIWKYSAKRSDKAVFSHGSHKLEMIWTGIPAALLVVIAFSQMNAWAEVKFRGAFKDAQGEPLPVFAEIFASQFDWRYRYPGPDGRFGTFDDIETAYELVVPLRETETDPDKRKLIFNLRSRDVLHSFFVPQLRVKQDAVPGMTIPIWFTIEPDEFEEAFAELEDKSFDVICTELCGWGHYKMSGRVRVLPDAEYDAWMAEQVAAKFSNL